jgi:hypothetical protein
VVLVSSYPHSWLRPIYARLRADSAFALLSHAHQFEALRLAVAAEAPAKAAEMTDWNTATQKALLGWLADVVAEHPNPSREVELWRMRKGDRELVCVTVYLPIGIDVRLLEGDGFRRTQLVKDAPAVEELAEKWRVALIKHGSDAQRTRTAQREKEKLA